MAATRPLVEPASDTMTRVAFGVPRFAATYLAVCQVALRRLERLAADRSAPLRG